MVQWLRVLSVLVEDPGLVPGPCSVAQQDLQFQSGGIQWHLMASWVPVHTWCTSILRHTHLHMK